MGLSHLEDGGCSYVVASYAGEERDPAWAKNLRAHPEATITVSGRSIAVVARELEGTRREEMFRRFVERDASYDEYRRRTSREIPVFELRPRDR